MKKSLILDPGHGLSNRKSGVFDPGAVSNGVKKSDIAMDWANELRAILRANGHTVVRTRVSATDNAPVYIRAGIARQYNGAVMLSFHCNASNGSASGTETFYRGSENAVMAKRINDCVVESLSTLDRGIKTEGASQHSRLAVMAFQPCFLLEIGFIDNDSDRQKMLDPTLRKATCEKLAAILEEFV